MYVSIVNKTKKQKKQKKQELYKFMISAIKVKNLLVKSSHGGKNGKLNEMIEVSALWSISYLSIFHVKLCQKLV